MLALAVRLLLISTPVLSEADLRIVERLAWRAGVPKGAVESLSTDMTGDGAQDIVLLTRTGDRLVLFLAEGPISPAGRWWRVDLHRGTEAGELCAPASAARVHVEDPVTVSHALECDRERTGACPALKGRVLRVEAGRCPAVHVFFDGSDLRFWSGAGTGGRNPTASIPADPEAPRSER